MNRRNFNIRAKVLLSFFVFCMFIFVTAWCNTAYAQSTSNNQAHFEQALSNQLLNLQKGFKEAKKANFDTITYIQGDPIIIKGEPMPELDKICKSIPRTLDNNEVSIPKPLLKADKAEEIDAFIKGFIDTMERGYQKVLKERFGSESTFEGSCVVLEPHGVKAKRKISRSYKTCLEQYKQKYAVQKEESLRTIRIWMAEQGNRGIRLYKEGWLSSERYTLVKYQMDSNEGRWGISSLEWNTYGLDGLTDEGETEELRSLGQPGRNAGMVLFEDRVLVKFKYSYLKPKNSKKYHGDSQTLAVQAIFIMPLYDETISECRYRLEF